MIRYYRLAAALLFLCAMIVRTQAQDLLRSYQPDPKASMREHNIDIERMLLEVRFKPEERLVIGTVTHYFSPIRRSIDSIYLDGPGIRFKSVKLDGKDVRYKAGSEGITIFPAAPLAWETKHELRMEYEANPKKGIYFIGWNDSTNRSRKQIWTQGQGIDNRYWIPSFDDPNDKLITETVVTTDAKFSVLSNGTKISEKKNSDGTKTWHYKMSHQHALYLTMLGIGEYAVYQTKAASGVPINEWYYPDQPEKREPTYRYTADIMNFYEKEIGYPFAWESYSQIPVQEFIYGAMENTTSTVFGDFFMVDKRAYLTNRYVGVNAHEMAHQWFGDLVTARSYKDQWLQESFATYYDKLAEQHLFGEDHYEWSSRGEANSALNASKENQLPIAHTQSGSARIYQKGSQVLGMLSYVTGREEYNKAIKYYLQKHAYGNVTTNDLMLAFHDVLGLDLGWFFDEWVMRGGEPNYKVSYLPLTVKGAGLTRITVEQIQQVNELIGYFRMPIVIEVHYKDGTTDTRTEIVDGKSQEIDIPNPQNKQVAFVLFDPGSKILKQVSFSRSFEELSTQALQAAHMIDRYDALVALRSTELSRKRSLLIDVYHKERFHATRAEVISQLVDDTDPSSRKLIQEALKDQDVNVRLAAVQNSGTINPNEVTAFEPLLTDSSYKVIESVLPRLVAANPSGKDHYLKLTDKLDGMNKSLRITWLTTALTPVGLPSSSQGALATTGNVSVLPYFDELVDYASAAFEFRTRNNAFQALLQLNYLDRKLATSLLDATQSWNGRLARPAQEALAYYARQIIYKSVIEQAIRDGKWNAGEKENMRKLLK